MRTQCDTFIFLLPSLTHLPAYMLPGCWTACGNTLYYYSATASLAPSYLAYPEKGHGHGGGAGKTLPQHYLPAFTPV